MFDPVSSQARIIHKRKRKQEQLSTSETQQGPSQCYMCGRHESKLYNGRCVSCEAKIAEAIFHHKIHSTATDKTLPLKKKVDAPEKKS